MPAMIRFGIIGFGGIARKAIWPVLKSSSVAELVAVASRTRERAEQIANEAHCVPVTGYANLLGRDDIDAVYIGLPIGLHAAWAIAAAEHGKHILCEKTLAVSVEETQKILDVCEQNGVALLEGFAYQFHSQHRTVRDVIASGKIGEPRLFHAWFGFPPIQSPHRYSEELGGGALLDAGTYTIHAARRFFDAEPTGIAAVLSNDGHEVDIHGTVLLDFGDKKTASLAFGFNNMYRNSYSVWGTKGIVTLLRAFSIPPHISPTIVLKTQEGREEQAMPPCNHFREEIEAFCRNIHAPEALAHWREDAFCQATVLESIRKANETHATIEQK